ncbi:MAG TPA: transposase, partial [Candidatus Ratteibacteria bacterium]|nr:transposase [Candidatus Ratteibacteria bacterium]
MKIKQIPDQSTINRFLRDFDIQSVSDLEFIFDILLKELVCSKNRKRVLIVDATGIVVFGNKFQFAKKGYFPKKIGNKGYQVSLGVLLKDYPKISSLFLDPANIALDLQLWDTIYQTADILGGLEYISLVIGDAIYGVDKHITDFIEFGIPFLLKGKNSKTIFTHLFTSIPKQHLSCVELFSPYNKRQIIETQIKENKNGLSIDNLRTSKFWGIYAFLYIATSVFNLFALFKETVLVGSRLEHLELTEITDKLM